MKRRLLHAAVCGSVLALTAGCSSGGSAGANAPKSNYAAAQVTTAPGTKPLDHVVWSGDYRPPYSEDPVKTADYPEETILGNVCETVIHENADYSLGPGVAKSWTQPDGRHLLLELDPTAAFSDGKPVTPDDVVYSLARNMDPATASNYADSYRDVSSIRATGPHQVTVTFTKDNYLFVRYLGALGGAVVEKAFALKTGQNFGNADVGVVCSGPYTVASFDGTSSLVLRRNPHYWNPARAAKVDTLEFHFYSDNSALTNALTSGAAQGAFNVPPAAVTPLSRATSGKLYIGGEGSTMENEDLIVSRFSGPLGDVRVRQALSLALDRAAIAKTVYSGAADPLYAVAGPGYWRGNPALGRYEAAYRALVEQPDPEGAKKLVAQVPGANRQITLGYPAATPFEAQLAQVIQQTGQQIGLNIKIVGLPDQQYGNLFTDPKARAGLDSFLTLNYMEFPEPAVMYRSFALPYGVQDFNGYDNPVVTQALERAQATQDPQARAGFVITAQQQLAKDLPWIPIAEPRALVFQNSGVTGAPLTFAYMDTTWAAALGAP
ncbi:ABC transporter substrate-binding protein [Streptacidiphilus jiangxiensis]|uniref:Peptide/nickel transport system substrate-binding protein n=1 Tax=Streptacidiphilus jiangxiensis TaxID=235985 RepID=A0A1H7NG57_STRJI|nr:ABC transporter substrate-binding protein [Streptacidiphilus jiangxiensis]SEL21958.1 peptide/nickel transport system substrate-binding protein [Streptacidiphilus jiangxiensis]